MTTFALCRTALPAWRAYHLLQEAFPQDVFASRVVFAIEREDESLSSADFQFVESLIRDLDKLRQDVPRD